MGASVPKNKKHFSLGSKLWAIFPKLWPANSTAQQSWEAAQSATLTPCSVLKHPGQCRSRNIYWKRSSKLEKLFTYSEFQNDGQISVKSGQGSYTELNPVWFSHTPKATLVCVPVCPVWTGSRHWKVFTGYTIVRDFLKSQNLLNYYILPLKTICAFKAVINKE